MKYGFGIDLGGTTCKLGLFEENGTLVEKWEIPTNKEEEGSHILPDIAHAILGKMEEKKLSTEDVLGLGIGVPGAVREGGIVNRCINLGWGVVPVSDELKRLTGLPAVAGNDANMAALGEYWKGSGAGFDSIALITLGTGIGGGLVLNGTVWNGFHGAGGEFGHVVVNPDELEACNCGNYGCIEQYASATGIARQARHALRRSDLPSSLRDRPDFSAKDVFDAAKEGDALAMDVVKEVCGLLGKLIADVCNIVNPEAVLIGGGVSRAGQILLENLQEAFRKNVFHACRDTKICLASRGNDAGIYGSMKLMLNNLK